MMRNSIATYKESLSRIASDVHEAADELQVLVPGDGEDALFSDRRISSRFAQSTSPNGSPAANGINSVSKAEIDLHKAEIQRLKTSETEIKTLAMNYAAMLKEKEEELTRLHDENCSLRKSMDPKTIKAEYLETQGSDGQLTDKEHNYTLPSVFISSVSNGHIGPQKEPDHPMNNGSGRSTPPAQSKYAAEMKELRLQLENEREKSANRQLKLQDQQKRNELLLKDLSELTIEREKASLEMKRMREDMDARASQIKQLEMSRSNADEFREKQEKILKLEDTLTITRKERDKAVKELTRLKQHLLEKELEESNKMDEDSRLIEGLQAHILKLETALKQEKLKSEEARQANETIDGLKQKVANYANILESRNAELQNLLAALGQYAAESEAKERLERDLVVAKGESARLSELLKEANEKVERSRAEKDEVLSKLAQAEKMSAEGKVAVQRLQEDNLRLRRTLEQSMTRINRMSLDSDYSVDRRIVIKLLLTYFERNHGKEVLDLMVRMLGFSEEEKRRIVGAQQAAGKGVVRGVLGLPGRLVGGIVGGSRDPTASPSSENQSFADLWVDFLVKETEEREKRELAEAAGGGAPGNPVAAAPLPHWSASTSDSEFATVPLTSSGPINPFENTRQMPGQSRRY